MATPTRDLRTPRSARVRPPSPWSGVGQSDTKTGTLRGGSASAGARPGAGTDTGGLGDAGFGGALPVMFWDGSVEPLLPPFPKLRVRRSYLYRITTFLAAADDTRELQDTKAGAMGMGAAMGEPMGSGPGPGFETLVPHSGHGHFTLEVATSHGLNPDGSTHLPNTTSTNEEAALSGWCTGWASIRLKLNGMEDVAMAVAAARSMATVTFDMSVGDNGAGGLPHVTAPLPAAWQSTPSASLPSVPLQIPSVSAHGLVGPVIGAVRPLGDGSGTVCFRWVLVHF